MTLIDLIIIAVALLVIWLGHWPAILVLLIAVVAMIVLRLVAGDRVWSVRSTP